MQENLAFPVWEPSQAGGARRAAVELAAKLDFTETERGTVAVVVSEIAKNLSQHAQRGIVLLRAVPGIPGEGLEILALDKGPGMASVFRCMEDGYSTAGTAGTGLGAIARMASFLDIQSHPGSGTALVARIYPGKPSHPAPGTPAPLRTGAVCLPQEGETVCGDSWAVLRRGELLRAVVADGLGHGPLAADASREAVRMFLQYPEMELVELLEAQHGALRATRGAAVAVAEIDPAACEVRFCGVGNISGTLVRPGRASSMVSHNGTVGHQLRKVHQFSYQWTEDTVMVLNSDGLGSQWKLENYPGLLQRDPALISGVLYRDFTRGRDDLTVVACSRVNEIQSWQSPS